MAPEHSAASASGPPTVWEVRAITADHVLAFHVSEPGHLIEWLVRGDSVLVEPAGPETDRNTGLTAAFTELAAVLPEPFNGACIRTDDVVRNTELVGVHRGELHYGSSGAAAFPIDGTGWCSEVFASDEGFLGAWVRGRVDARTLAKVLWLDSLWSEEPERLWRFVQIVDALHLHDDLRNALASGEDFWQLAEPLLSDTKLAVPAADDSTHANRVGFSFERWPDHGPLVVPRRSCD
jgi:hypothetical protein